MLPSNSRGIGIRFIITIALILRLAGVAYADGKIPRQRIGSPADEDYALLARTLHQRGWNFDQIFAASCQRALTNALIAGKQPIQDQVRAVFGGLWLWSRRGGAPALQGQNDKALHFIGGGVFEGYWDMGRRAAVTKERIDSKDLDNFWDFDDLAATIMGARWMDVALDGDADHTRRWIELWASSRYTLSRSLPQLKFGHMRPGQRASPEQVEAIDRQITAALVFPATDK